MPLNLDPLPVSYRRMALFAGCVAWFSLLAFWHRGVVMDDPWITFRYARNVVEGAGWVFNPGESVEGYSNFSWVLASTAAHFANIEPLGFARLISWLSGAALFWVLCFGLGRGRQHQEIAPCSGREDVFAGHTSFLPRSATAAVLLASCYPLAVWTMGGLETVFYTLLVFLSIGLLARAWNDGGLVTGAAAGAMLALAAASRPEGAMFAALLAVALVLAPSRRVRGALGLGLGVFTLIFLVYIEWRFQTYGTIVPNTVTAKIGGETGSTLFNGVKYFFGYFGGAPILLVVLGGIAAARAVTRMTPPGRADYTSRLVILCAGAVVLQLLFAVAVGGDWMPAARFFVPMLPPLCLLAAWLIRPWPLFARGVVLAFFLLAGLVQAKRDPFLNWCRWAVKEEDGHLLVDPLIEAGKYLRDAAPGDAVLAATEAGVMPYYSRLPFIDMLGLVDPHIAALPGGLHEKFDAEYVLGREPGYIALQFTGGENTLAPTWPSDAAVAESVRFQQDYEEIARFKRPLPTEDWGMQEGWLVLYRQR